MNPSLQAPLGELRKSVPGQQSESKQIGNPMKRRSSLRFAVLGFVIVLGGSGELMAIRAQSSPLNPALVAAKWPASWIASPSAPAKAPGVFYFREELRLAALPQHYWVHVSAGRESGADAIGLPCVERHPELRHFDADCGYPAGQSGIQGSEDCAAFERPAPLGCVDAPCRRDDPHGVRT
jgi:hypothetical protein